ncbi:MAG: hypothetical protein K5906_01555 [Bacilli bacterium]|nr:hypothetical protein [Bacilli bacterium]
MQEQNITDNKKNLNKICSITLAVIFFILSFLTGFNNIVIFVLALLTLAISIFLSYKSFKDVHIYVLGIVLIPLLAYGVIASLGHYSEAIYSVSTRVFLVINIVLFLMAGYFSRFIKGFSFKWIFIGIFLSLSIISLINLISTSINFGPFYGLRIPYYYSYYQGVEANETVSASAYALCGYSIKLVPIEYYLVYPMLLISSLFFYILDKKKDKLTLISVICFIVIGLISLIFVISKISLIFIVLYLFFIVLVGLLLTFKKLYNKGVKIALISLVGLAILFFIIFFINSQYSFTSFRSFIASNRLLNYLFNTNRYAENARVILNQAFSGNKLIGFPSYFDYQYLYLVHPSNDIIINQFMYGGVFAFIFFIVLVVLFIYTFINIKKLNLEDKTYKYFPMLFVASYFVISLIADQNTHDMFDYNLSFATYLSPFFLISLFIFGHYYALANEEVKENEA